MELDELKLHIKNMRIYSVVILVVSLIVSSALLGTFIGLGASFKHYWYIFVLFILTLPVILSGIIFITIAYSLRLRHISYRDIEIDCYGGYERKYLYVNGELMDEVCTSPTFSSRELSCKYQDYDIVMDVMYHNKIEVKINGSTIGGDKYDE